MATLEGVIFNLVFSPEEKLLRITGISSQLNE